MVENPIKPIHELSISGGGVKGYAYLGVLYQLDTLGLLNNLTKVSGVSIGSLFAVALVIGWKPKDLIDYLFEYDISKVKDIDIKNFFSSKSFLNGTKYKNFIENIIIQKTPKTTTLKELYDKTNIHLTILSACVTDKCIKYINHETDPDLDLITLILMSSSIPGLFPPCSYNGKLYIDGAILDNRPLIVSEQCGLGVCQKSSPENIDNVELKVPEFFGTILYMIYNTLHTQQKQSGNWIEVEYGDIQVTSFNITKDEKLSLIKYGIEATNKYIINHFPSVSSSWI